MLSLRRDRRRHVVYMTRHTEYHCRERECVGVRDRETGEWFRDHPALRGKLVGAFYPGRRLLRDQPAAGMRLVFAGKLTVMTSKLMEASRPERETIFSYTSLCAAGVIA